MFKFNFFENQTETTETKKNDDKVWIKAEKIVANFSDQNERQKDNNFKINVCQYGKVEIKSLSENNIIDILKKKGSECVLAAEIQHSDLVTAKYEGGFKVWECTIDLINYLDSQKVDFKDKKVLDLGCGCGILGIYSLLKGASVDFQDYNKEVIENITVPNVVLNSSCGSFDRCSFYSGDWGSSKSLLDQNKYDYILTSETIYNQENYSKLIDIFSSNLKPDGLIFLAAKTYYFGVGGGTREFETFLDKFDSFRRTNVWKSELGLKRVIIKIVKTS